MTLGLKKGRDGPSTLTCTRDDGTRTWSKPHPFFPVHDLTHCAVESVLGLDQAFLGLVASGWDIDDFAAHGVAARLPFEALWAESIVGLLDLERGTGNLYSAAEINDALTRSLGDQTPALDEEALDRIRRLRDGLAARWETLEPGATIEVCYPLEQHG